MSELITGVYNEGFEAGYEQALQDLETFLETMLDTARLGNRSDYMGTYCDVNKIKKQFVAKKKGTKNDNIIS